MSIGIVRWFNTTKSYAFIKPEDGTADVFVHISNVERAGLGSLKEGQRLDYGLVRVRNGMANAGNLKAA